MENRFRKKKGFMALHNRNRRLGTSPLSWFVFIVLIIAIAYMTWQLTWGLFTSLKDVNEFMDNKLGLPEGAPWTWAWSNYSYIFKHFNVPVITTDGRKLIWFEELLLNSLILGFTCTLVKVGSSTWAAYLTAKFDYKLSNILNATVLITMMVPLYGSSGALLKLMRGIDLYDTFIGIALQKLHFLDMIYLILYAGFKAVPKDYTEAAIIDGAGQFTIFFRVNLPMVTPLLLTFTLTTFIGVWNDYTTPLIYLPSKPTLAYGVYYLTNTNVQGFSRTPMRMSTSYLAAIPMLFIFVIFRKKIMRQMSLGGIKE